MSHSKKDWLAFIIGLLTLIQIRVVGTIGIAELLTLGLVIFIMPFACFKDRRFKKAWLLGLLWLIGAVISNIYNRSSMTDSIKGGFSLFLFLVDLIVAYWILKDNYKRILYYLGGLAISNLLALYVFPTSTLQSMIDNGSDLITLYDVMFNYYFAPTIIAIASILYYKRKIYLSTILIECFAVYTLFHFSRNIFLTWTIVAVLILYFGKLDQKNQAAKEKKYSRDLLKILCILAIALFCIDRVYEYSASRGMLGERASMKYDEQKYESGDLGLFSGREDFFISLKAISESPIFGYGSYATDKTNIVNRFRLEHHIDKYNDTSTNYIPGHSYILGAWVYNGIFGVFFWLYVFYLLYIFLKRYLLSDVRLLVCLLLLIIPLIWNILFSPFAARLQESMTIVLLIMIMNKFESQIKQKSKLKYYG